MTTSSELDRPSGEPDPRDGSGDQGTLSAPGTQGSHRAAPSPGGFSPASLKGPRALRAALVAVGMALLAAAYLAQARTTPMTSEGSSQALQAWDMLHGNLLLHGWSLSDVSFWTTELPEYMLVEVVRGLNANTVPIAAAISYFGQVVLAGFLAKGSATGKQAWVRILIAVGIMLAPPLGAATTLLMSSPDHTGTHVPLLLIYLVLDRVRPRWWLPIVITVMLAWAQVADTLVLVEGAVPIAAVCLMRVYRQRGPWKAQWYALSLLVGAALSAGLAKVILKLVGHAGGFYVRAPVAQFGTADQISAWLWRKIESFLLVFGADFFGKVVGGSAIITVLHLVGIALVLWALAHVIRRFYIEEDQILQMFALAFVLVLAAYILGTKPDSNEIVGLLPIGAVLAGRALGGKVISIRLVPALGAVFVVMAFVLLANAMHPSVTNGNDKVALWLRAHHLDYGLAGYWNASSVTAESGDVVKVRPIRTYQDSVVTTNFQTNSTWYNPNKNYANFVLKTKTSCGDLCLTKHGLAAAFGRPAHIDYIGNYVVMVYNRNLLTSVSEVAFCGGAWPWQAKGPPTTDLTCQNVPASAP